jgi:LemA protein
MIGWIILAIIVLLAIGLLNWFVSTQRQLVNLDELCNNALSQIEVQLNSRWDAIMQLAQQAANYAQHESQTLIETIRARRGSEIKTADDVNDQNTVFGSVLGRLMVVAEQYPELKASNLYAEVMQAVNNFENNVRNSRMIYNDTATKMNRYVRQWPSSFIANMLHFDTRNYLKMDNEDKRDISNMPNVGAPK